MNNANNQKEKRLVGIWIDCLRDLYREDAPFFHSTKNLDFYNLFTLSHGDLYLKTLLL